MASGTGKTLVQGTVLAVLSILFTLGVAEMGLRLFYPKYEFAAEAQFKPDSLRITTRPPNSRRTMRHPDNGKTHLVIYNNYGMRQHRDFQDSDLEGATNVGIFGDSYMENVELPGPYSFTEPLDYLLNLSGRRFNVLNFGQGGYGTGQSYMAYRYTELVKRLDPVYYVFCANDIRNIYENNLFYLDESGVLQRNPALESPWWIKIVSRLHVTYLLQDSDNRLNPRKNAWEGFNARILQEKHADKYVRKRIRSDRAKSVEQDLLDGKENDDVRRSLAIFQAILREWKDLVTANGAHFTVVLLPTGRGRGIKDYIDDDIPVVDLYELFSKQIPDYDYRDWKFENDGHWAEAANSLAAAFLYQDIAGQTGLSAIPEQGINQAFFTYYSAFDYGWMPDKPDSDYLPSQTVLEAISRKYNSLELDSISGR